MINLLEDKIQKYIESIRPTIEIRNEIDLIYTFDNNSVEIFEVTPHFQIENEKIKTPIAKAKYIKSKKIWKVYWMGSNLKWIPYEPYPIVKSLDKFIEILKNDPIPFFG